MKNLIDIEKIRNMSDIEIVNLLEYFYCGGINNSGAECDSFIDAIEHSLVRKRET